MPSAFCKFQCESVKLLPISYVRCSMFELFQFTFICNLESFSFARWRSVNLSTTFLVTDLPIIKQFVHSPAYGCPLSVANTSMCGERERWALAFGWKWFLKNCGTLSRGFGLKSFRSKLTNLNILRIGKSVFVFVFVDWAFIVNLRPTKTTQAEISGGISGRKLLRPKPLESVPPQFFLPLPSPSNKAGWAYRSKLLRDKFFSLSPVMSPAAFRKAVV